MTATERAIRDAVEKGGYLEPVEDNGRVNYDAIMLDHEFWRCLGIARDWSRGIDPETGEMMLADPSDTYAQDVAEDNCHQLVAHLFEGKSAEDFFISLEG